MKKLRGRMSLILYIRYAVILLVVVTNVYRTLQVAAEENDEGDENNDTVARRVDELRQTVGVDFSSSSNDQIDWNNPRLAAEAVSQEMATAALRKRLTKLFAKTQTAACRQKISQHLSYFMNAIPLEESLPFSDVQFQNECGEPVYMWDDLPDDMHPGMIQNRSYQPPRNETDYLEDPADLRICYGILTHDNAAATIRLIEALYEPGHIFVVHVDGKFADTQAALLQYEQLHSYIHVLTDEYRVRVNWGGFSMVNATLQLLRYALDESNDLEFHKFVHLSASTYPLASNSEIRQRLASYPLDANFLNVIMQPVRPGSYVWHYFVECDDAVHRIYQLPVLQSSVSKADLFTASQWFIISRDFAQYLANPEPGSFVADYLKYVEHVVVADETFFGTVLRHTAFCHHHHNRNFLHLQFDRWESELPADKRDDKKCPMPDPNHCGRSPTIMTVDYADILELSDDLFARKFDDSVDAQVKDIIDDWRDKRQEKSVAEDEKRSAMEFEGHGVLIVAKETTSDEMPLCLGLGPTGNHIQLVPCFYDWVPPTLGDDWETGGVIEQETPLHLRWLVSPCTSDGSLARSSSGHINVTKGTYSSTGPRCKLKQIDGIRAGRCYDGQADTLQPGGHTQVYPCIQQWFQFVSFGDGEHAPYGSLLNKIPSHVVNQIRNLGHAQSPYMCLGVYGRGTQDEVSWSDSDYTLGEEKDAPPDPSPLPLSDWRDEEIITTKCSNRNAVIEWVFVPYIVEEPETDDGQEQDESNTDASREPAANECDVTDSKQGADQCEQQP